MDFRPRFRCSLSIALLAAFLSLVFGTTAALASTGTIDATNHYAWDDNGGYVNWNATVGNVTVTDTALTGYIWSAGFGWINLSPTQGGVTNNAGVLGGYAWGANTGWINFAGVTIDSNGLFHGQTTAQSLFGTMTFDCAYCNITTTWRSSTIAPTNTTNTGSGGGTISGPLSYQYRNGNTAPASTSSQPPASLTPTTPPPKTEPTIGPSSGVAPPVHLTPSITLSISSNPSDVGGTPITVHVVIASTQRSQNITLAYRLYSSSGATVYASAKTLAPHDPSSFSISIPGNTPIGAYTIAVSAQYGKQPIQTQTLPISIYSTQAEAGAHASSSGADTTQPAASSCSWLGCWWQGIKSDVNQAWNLFTHLF
jgi:hypothetical protein